MLNELDDSVLERGRRVIAAIIVEPLMYFFSASQCCDVAKWVKKQIVSAQKSAHSLMTLRDPRINCSVSVGSGFTPDGTWSTSESMSTQLKILSRGTLRRKQHKTQDA
jgi:hypothetical protein